MRGGGGDLTEGPWAGTRTPFGAQERRAPADSMGIATTLAKIGSLYKRLGQQDEAHASFLSALAIQEVLVPNSMVMRWLDIELLFRES